MIYLVFYDITSNALRAKIASMLIAEGFVRIQLSVYAGIRNPIKNKPLWTALNKHLAKEPLAKFFVIKISENNFKKMYYIGISDLDMDYLTGSCKSMFF